MMEGAEIIPFSAIVGQMELKRALLLNAINPRIGGLLIRGEKGTAKSTAVRALAEVLPEIEVVKNCPFHADPVRDREFCIRCGECGGKGNAPGVERRQVQVVTLPLGVTEDRLLGTLDIERAIQKGVKAFEPGILAACHRGILYIDEVNLLDDHIVDVLLDVAAMGVNTVEREGISFSHPSRFILIGTMNPEEGELRPQLLDRFGLQVTISGLSGVEQRMEIVRVVERFEQDPVGFRASCVGAQRELQEQIAGAIARLKGITMDDGLLRYIASACNELGVKTHRAEITVARAAKAIAALDGRTSVTGEDVREAMHLALPHRLRRRPFEDPDLDRRRLDDLMDRLEGGGDGEEDRGPRHPHEGRHEYAGKGGGKGSRSGKAKEQVIRPGKGIDSGMVMRSRMLPKGKERYDSGRRVEVETPLARGRYRSPTERSERRELALDASIRAAAIHQDQGDGIPRVRIRLEDLRFRERFGRTSAAILFLVDASGSMGAEGRMQSAKGAVLSLLEDAYRHRDRIGLIAFRGEQADEILPFTQSTDLAAKRLAEVPTGGRTPLSSGLDLALRRFEREREKHPHLIPLLILLSDGHANVGMGGRIGEELLALSRLLADRDVHTVVIDTEAARSDVLSLGVGFCRKIAQESNGAYYRITDLDPGTLEGIALTELEEHLLDAA
ncbi:MAG: VWA domain-containing protein [Methanomicrobiales archaeon]|nr:VWA domain-containing protein [Methanomicrobiales archaeon]